MVVGLGTGSTAYYAIRRIGDRVREGLAIKGVCTSVKTRELAHQFGIPTVDLEEVGTIDMTIDGADEVDPVGQGIKGGGGALLFEKIVAMNSTQNIWVVEKRKLVRQLGAFPLPVEIIPFGYKKLLRRLEGMDLNPELRMNEGGIFVTDGHHYIVDLNLQSISDPEFLNEALHHLPGVVEHGLFLNTVNKVVAAGPDGVDVISFR
jgi:ribose 5-phosphate isomerase A